MKIPAERALSLGRVKCLAFGVASANNTRLFALLNFKSANNLVLLADARPSARHFSLAETKGSFGEDFHLVF